jgi:hypothetical protein
MHEIYLTISKYLMLDMARLGSCNNIYWPHIVLRFVKRV